MKYNLCLFVRFCNLISETAQRILMKFALVFISKHLACFILIKKKKNQLYAVSRTQQGRQREPSVKTLRSRLSTELWRHCVVKWRNSTPRFASKPDRENEHRSILRHVLLSYSKKGFLSSIQQSVISICLGVRSNKKITINSNRIRQKVGNGVS